MSLTERYRGTPYDLAVRAGAVGESRASVSRARTLVIIAPARRRPSSTASCCQSWVAPSQRPRPSPGRRVPSRPRARGQAGCSPADVGPVGEPIGRARGCRVGADGRQGSAVGTRASRGLSVAGPQRPDRRWRRDATARQERADALRAERLGVEVALGHVAADDGQPACLLARLDALADGAQVARAAEGQEALGEGDVLRRRRRPVSAKLGCSFTIESGRSRTTSSDEPWPKSSSARPTPRSRQGLDVRVVRRCSRAPSSSVSERGSRSERCRTVSTVRQEAGVGELAGRDVDVAP